MSISKIVMIEDRQSKLLITIRMKNSSIIDRQETHHIIDYDTYLEKRMSEYQRQGFEVSDKYNPPGVNTIGMITLLKEM